MSVMQILSLRGNKLHGRIPHEICNLNSIQILDFSINNQSWIIPDCFDNFTILSIKNSEMVSVSENLYDPAYSFNENKHYAYSSFQWKGVESMYWSNINDLKLIDFSCNRLIGNIPKSVSTMRGLISLKSIRN